MPRPLRLALVLGFALAATTLTSARNALVAAKTMTGINGNTIYALPHDQLRAVLQKYGRLNAR